MPDDFFKEERDVTIYSLMKDQVNNEDLKKWTDLLKFNFDVRFTRDSRTFS